MNDDLADLLRDAADAAPTRLLDAGAMTRAVRRRRRLRAAATGAVALTVAAALGTTAAAVAPHVFPSSGASTASGLPAADASAPLGACGSVVQIADLAQQDDDVVLGVYASGTGYGPTSTPVGQVGAAMVVTGRTGRPIAAAVTGGSAFLVQGGVVVARVDATSGSGLPSTVGTGAFGPWPWLIGRIPTTSCSSGRALPDGDYVLAGDVTVERGGRSRVVVTGGEKVTLVGGARAEGCTAGLPPSSDVARTVLRSPLEIGRTGVPDAPPNAWAVRIDAELDLEPATAADVAQIVDDPDVYLVDDSGAVAARSDVGSIEHAFRSDGLAFQLGLEPTFRPCGGGTLAPGTYHVATVWRLERLDAGVTTVVSDVGAVTVPAL